MKRPSLDCIKCVIVGDGAVGKTCMLVSYATNKFPSTHVPTVFDNYAVTMTVNDTPMVVVVYDTAGQEEYDRLRVLAYPDTDVFVVCFSVVIPASFENVTEKWVPEIRHHRPATPYILVGTQVDKRDNFHELQELLRNKQKPIAFEQGQSLASRLKAAGYVECSALTQHGLKAVFDTAMTAIIHTRLPVAKKPEKRRCVFL